MSVQAQHQIWSLGDTKMYLGEVNLQTESGWCPVIGQGVLVFHRRLGFYGMPVIQKFVSRLAEPSTLASHHNIIQNKKSKQKNISPITMTL